MCRVNEPGISGADDIVKGCHSLRCYNFLVLEMGNISEKFIIRLHFTLFPFVATYFLAIVGILMKTQSPDEKLKLGGLVMMRLVTLDGRMKAWE